MTPHKHAALIKQWAEGAEIEYKGLDSGKWLFVSNPNWESPQELRVKPAAPKLRKVKMLGWLTKGSGLMLYGSDITPNDSWKRVPAEDKIIEVEE